MKKLKVFFYAGILSLTLSSCYVCKTTLYYISQPMDLIYGIPSRQLTLYYFSEDEYPKDNPAEKKIYETVTYEELRHQQKKYQ